MKKEKKPPECIAVIYKGVEYPIKSNSADDLPIDIRKQMAQKLLECQLKIEQMDY